MSEGVRRALIALSLLLPAHAGAEQLEQPRLGDLLTPDQRQSVHHSVESVELRDGYYSFSVDSDYGTFEAQSLPQLRGLLNEIAVLAQAMGQYAQGSPDAGPQLRSQFSIEADSAVDIITRPVRTATDLAGQLGDNLDQAVRGSPVLIGEYNRVDFAAADSADPTTSMHKRNVAAQWGLDVYSSNPVVQDFLNTAAHDRAGGRISAGAPSFFNPPRLAERSADAGVDAEVGRRLKVEDANTLRDGNRRALLDMQVPAAAVDAFLAHPAFSPRHHTRITAYLAALGKVLNRGALVESALRSDGERGAVAHEHLAMMLLYFHRHVAPLQKLHFGNNVLQAIHGNNNLLVLQPEDVLGWSADVQRNLDAVAKRAKDGGLRGLDLLAAGAVSPSAQVQVGARGFTLRDHMIF